MELSESQRAALRALYLARGDALEALMIDRLVARGVDEDRARAAARSCARKIWQNSLLSGGATTLIVGTLFTPAVGAIAGSSMAVLAGWETLLTSDSCETVRDADLTRAAELEARGL